MVVEGGGGEPENVLARILYKMQKNPRNFIIFCAVSCARLKVPSDQIGSAGEWYHWIGLKKDINRYMFLIF